MSPSVSVHCRIFRIQIRKQELPEYTHIAFSVEQKHFQQMSDRIKQTNTKIFKENKSEGDSLYFLDPNGHKLEIHVGTWQSRLASYTKDPNAEVFI